MAGFLVVILAVGGAIFGTIILNSDESTTEITKYDYKTDVTGLFPVDTSPEYYDYDLARNYTGYFTADTQINGVNYFGGATFRNSSVNNYPIKTAPDNSNTSSETITSSINSNMDNTSPSAYTGITYYRNQYGNSYSFSTQSYTRTVESLLRELDLNGYDVIEIKTSAADYDDHFHWAFFGTKDQFSSATVPHVSYVKQQVYGDYPTDGYYVACHSIKVDKKTSTVNFYFDDTTSSNSYVMQSAIGDAVISYSSVAFLNGSTGVPIDVVAYDTGNVEYMDISQGVTVTGVTE